MADGIKFTIISNITLEVYFKSALQLFFAEIEKSVDLTFIDYNECKWWVNMEEVHSMEERHSMEEISTADYVVVCLNFEYMFPKAAIDIVSGKVLSKEIREYVVGRCKTLYSCIKQNSYVPVIWFGFEDYYCLYHYVCGAVSGMKNLIDEINCGLAAFVEINDVYLDMKRLIAEAGISKAYSDKDKYRWNEPYSTALISQMCREIYQQYQIYNGMTKKCIVLDCDNVLWGGNLADDGIDKVILGGVLGRAYQDFQRFLLYLYYHGVILTICSKNDEADVREMFCSHSGMLLKEEHIACFRVNWSDKASNIREIAQTLNIGMNSMVFIDDSEFEISAVRALLPEVTSIMFDIHGIYRDLSCFHLRNSPNAGEIKSRNDAYRMEDMRKKVRTKCSTIDEYMKELEMKLEIHKMLPSEVARVAELTQRTNKCTNGVRYHAEQMRQKMESSDYEVYSVSCSDKFSDLGVIGVIGLRQSELDLFALSCRALGRKIEDEMISFVKKRGISTYRFKSTFKNEALEKRLEVEMVSLIH